jgi:hypothetical protein
MKGEGNHIAKLQRLLASGEVVVIPGVTMIDVRHAPWCRSLKRRPRPCNCDPDIAVRWTLGALARN